MAGNIPTEEVDQSMEQDVGLVGRDDNVPAMEVEQEDGAQGLEGDEGENLLTVEMGDNRDSVMGDWVEKEEDPLGMEVCGGMVTDKVLNRCIQGISYY